MTSITSSAWPTRTCASSHRASGRRIRSSEPVPTFQGAAAQIPSREPRIRYQKSGLQAIVCGTPKNKIEEWIRGGVELAWLTHGDDHTVYTRRGRAGAGFELDLTENSTPWCRIFQG